MKIIKQSGFTLIELMVSLVLGLIVIGGVLSIYLTTITSSSNSLSMSKLNYELGTLMTMMVRDIRRAGYDSSVSIANPDNEFNVFGRTAPSIRDDKASDTLVSVTGSGECILYTYDQGNGAGGSSNGTLDNEEFFGFRLNNDVLEMRASVSDLEKLAIVGGTADTCNTGFWFEITDGQTIKITDLTFDMAGSTCINTEGLIDCYATAPAGGDTTVEIRLVKITLDGQFINDPELKMSITHSVRIRNDLVREN